MSKSSSRRIFKKTIKDFLDFKNTNSYDRMIKNQASRADYVKLEKLYSNSIKAGEKAFEETLDMNISTMVEKLISDKRKIFGGKTYV